MSDKYVLKLTSPAVRERAIALIRKAPDGYCVALSEETRSLAQNRLMWPMIKDIREQNEVMAGFTRDQVKLRFLNTLDNEMTMLPELEGGGHFIVGQRSSTLTKAQFGMLIELIYKWGAENGILWSHNSYEAFAELGIS